MMTISEVILVDRYSSILSQKPDKSSFQLVMVPGNDTQERVIQICPSTGQLL